MKKVILVRHGESFANVNNIISEELDKYPLTQRGVEQTLFTGEQLKDLKFNGILYSPVLRTNSHHAHPLKVNIYGPLVHQRVI
ncbi:MAG: histidine phosphatase family protein [Thermoplasmatales archaeon]